MIYRPMIIFNPRSTPVEFMYDHQVQQLGPGEKKLFDGEIAYHALNHVKAGLKEYVPSEDDAIVASTNIAYTRMPWKELITLASERKLFHTGMNKLQTVKALVEADAKRSGSI